MGTSVVALATVAAAMAPNATCRYVPEGLGAAVRGGRRGAVSRAVRVVLALL